MASEGGMEDPAVRLRELAAELTDEPTSFDFFQAVHSLHRLMPDRMPVGRASLPEREAVRFSVNPGLGFPAGEIHALQPPADGGPASMTVNFFGLTGFQGVLPHPYTLLHAEGARTRNGALGGFLDIFHHRLLSLLYRAWERARPTVARELGAPDRVEEHLLDLAGAGPTLARSHPSVPLGAMTAYAGLFALPQRGAVALEQLLEDVFGVSAEVEQFAGCWCSLPPNDRCTLDDDGGGFNRLGEDLVVGDEIWDARAGIRIHLGPLSRGRYDDFLPGGSAHQDLRSLTRSFCQGQNDVEVRLVLAADDLPECRLGVEGAEAPTLGRSAWLRSPESRGASGETILRM
jgi:type VI secretion system protein ImpH